MEKEKKKKIINVRALFNNTKFLLLLSFLLSCIFWVAFASSSGEESTVSVTEVPVTIELPEQAVADGLKVYRGGEQKVTVQIKGNRLTAGSISKNDIQVVAQNTSAITVADTYAISLSAKKNSVKTDYEILSVTPSVINITVDKERQQEYAIDKNIDTSQVTLSKSDDSNLAGYYLARPVLSTDTVTVTGPEQEVKKINKAQVSDIITGEQSSNITKTLNVQLLDSDGEVFNSDMITVTPKTVEVTIQILPKKDVKIIPTFTNVPSGIDTTAIATVKPSTITVAGPQQVIEKLDTISLDPIDFSTLDPTKTQITSAISLPNGCIDISNQEQAKISLDLSDYSTTVVSIDNFLLSSISEGYTASVTTSAIDITIAGPTDTISEITSSDIIATADLSRLAGNFEGSQEVPVTISFVNQTSCWCINSYTVTVSVKKAE